MVGKWVVPNHYTFPLLVKVCVEIGLVREGKKVHARVVKFGFEADLFVRNSLIHMYSVCGRIGGAWIVFDTGPDMDLVAKGLFERMPCRDVVLWNCMIDGYARIGNVSVAREFFDPMPMRNVVSWNIMLALCVRFEPNEATLVGVLTVCASLGRLDRGNWVYSYLKSNRIKPDLLLSTALLTMYAKCGAMDLARDVFDKMPNRSVVSWNSMIMGYGMVLEGWWCFDLMCRVYMIEPKVEHYGCMVDLLARAGLMKDSEEIISKMPMESGPALWGALLSACRTHSNSALGEIVAKWLIELEPRDIGPYVLLLNIYVAEGKWDDVEYVRRMMKEKGLQKHLGLAWFTQESLNQNLLLGMVQSIGEAWYTQC
ncbi:hypothetical protein FH972_014513 [Carpinus fangiana]|uniref:Pentatricopeptide repeat-containing protein n=1 Tax=Carpinus fangiana TaxID=176857 RepID=A0A5N6RBU4_9ROSI|nr:hypothetical protein FH972_014513 [Carpinus fangiana]